MTSEPMRPRVRWWRALIPVLAITGAGFSAAACGAGPSTRTVASLPGHSGGTSPQEGQSSSQLSAQSDRDLVSFTHCMRRHGVAMADPSHIPGHAGLSVELPPQDAHTAVAYGACNHLIAKDIAAKEAGAAAQAAPNLQALTNYAVCMRAHDISMPEPQANGQLNLGPVPGLSSTFGRYSPQFRSADAACRHLLPAGTRDDGTGP